MRAPSGKAKRRFSSGRKQCLRRRSRKQLKFWPLRDGRAGGGNFGKRVGSGFDVLHGCEGPEAQPGRSPRGGRTDGLVREGGTVDPGAGEDAVMTLEDARELVRLVA